MRFGNTARKIAKELTKDVETTKYWGIQFENSKTKRGSQELDWARNARTMDDNLWSGGRMYDGSEPLEINELKSTVMTILPNILLEEPKINVRSYRYDLAPIAMIWEKIGNNMEYQLQLFKLFLEATYDTLLYGDGILKLGISQGTALQQPQYMFLRSGSPDVRLVKPSQVSLFEVYPDYRVKKWFNQRFLMQLSYVHIQDLMDNPSYEKKVVWSLRPTYAEEEVFGIPSHDSVNEKESVYVPVVEVHDFANSKMRLFALQQGGDNASPSDFLFNDAIPYGMSVWRNLQFMKRPQVLWGDSISQVVEKHQRQLSQVYTYMSRALNREGVLKVLYNLVAFGDETQAGKLVSDKDEYIGVNVPPGSNLDAVTANLNLGTSVKDFNFITAVNTIKSEIRAITGVTQQERGVHEAGVETKFEAAMLQAGGDVRNALRRRTFSLYASDVLQGLFYMASVEYTPERLAAMAGLDPFKYAPIISKFLPFDPSQFKVDYGRTAINSQRERVEKLQMFVQLMGPMMQVVNPAVWMKMVTEELDFEYEAELILFQALGMLGPSNSLSSSPTATNIGQEVAQSRVAPQQQGVLQS